MVENTPLNSVLLVVKAVDKDEGRNGYVEYTLHNHKSTFSLGVVDGLLRVIGNIDREDASNYTLNVRKTYILHGIVLKLLLKLFATCILLLFHMHRLPQEIEVTHPYPRVIHFSSKLRTKMITVLNLIHTNTVHPSLRTHPLGQMCLRYVIQISVTHCNPCSLNCGAI